MEKDHRLRKNYYFCLSFLSKGRTYNPVQNIWSKIEKPSKTGQSKKSLIFTFAFFWTAIAKVESRKGILCTGLCLHPNFESFLICLKVFFLFSTLPMMIKISGKNAHLVQES